MPGTDGPPVSWTNTHSHTHTHTHIRTHTHPCLMMMTGVPLGGKEVTSYRDVRHEGVIDGEPLRAVNGRSLWEL